MKRAFNYTKRIKLTKDHYHIKVVKDDDRTTFTAEITAEGLSLPSNSPVHLEVYHRNDTYRYDFGTLNHLLTSEDHDISHFPDPKLLRFRIKISDPAGKILAAVDQIKPEMEGIDTSEHEGILPVEFEDLEQRVWKLAYGENGPILILNNTIPGIREKAQSDSAFFFLVYPYVLREILFHLVFIEGLSDIEDPELPWHKHWFTFAIALYAEEDLSFLLYDHVTEKENRDEVETWIDNVVEAFGRQHHRTWKTMIQRYRESS